MKNWNVASSLPYVILFSLQITNRTMLSLINRIKKENGTAWYFHFSPPTLNIRVFVSRTFFYLVLDKIPNKNG
jgi:hypothetical protein